MDSENGSRNSSPAALSRDPMMQAEQRRVFEYYCSFGERVSVDLMSATKFMKFAKQSGLLDGTSLTPAEIDLLFIKAAKNRPDGAAPRPRGRGENRIDYNQFELLLGNLAANVYPKDDAAVAYRKLFREYVQPNGAKVAPDPTGMGLRDFDVRSFLEKCTAPLESVYRYYCMNDMVTSSVPNPEVAGDDEYALGANGWVKFCTDIGTHPQVLNKGSVLKIFRSANRGASADDDSLTMSLPEFVEAVGRLAQAAMPQPGQSALDRVQSLIRKISEADMTTRIEKKFGYQPGELWGTSLTTPGLSATSLPYSSRLPGRSSIVSDISDELNSDVLSELVGGPVGGRATIRRSSRTFSEASEESRGRRGSINDSSLPVLLNSKRVKDYIKRVFDHYNAADSVRGEPGHMRVVKFLKMVREYQLIDTQLTNAEAERIFYEHAGPQGKLNFKGFCGALGAMAGCRHAAGGNFATSKFLAETFLPYAAHVVGPLPPGVTQAIEEFKRACSVDPGVEAVQRVLAMVQRNSAESIELSNKMINAESLRMLCDSLAPNRSVCLLNLRRNRLEGNAIAALASCVEVNTYLRYIDLAENALGDDGITALCRGLKRNVSVVKLDIGSTGMGSVGTKALAPLLQTNASLQVLIANHNDLGPYGTRDVANALKHNAALEVLEVADCSIGDSGMEPLGKALMSQGYLREISLDANGLGNEAAECLAAALSQNSTLRCVFLRDNNIEDSGATSLAQSLETNRSLGKLFLSGNAFGVEGIRAFGDSLQRNHSMQMMSFPTRGKHIDPTLLRRIEHRLDVNKSRNFSPRASVDLSPLDINAMESSLERLARANAEQAEALEAKDEMLLYYESKIEGLTRAEAITQEELAKATSQAEKEKDKCDALTEELDNMTDALKEAKSEYTKEKEHLQKTMFDLYKDIDGRVARETELERMLSEATDNINSNSGERDVFEEQLRYFQDKAAKAEVQVTDLRKNMSDIEKALEIKEEENQSIHRRLEHSIGENGELRTKIGDLEFDKETARKKIVDLETSIRELSNKCAAESTVEGSLRSDLRRVEDEASSLRATRDELRQHVRVQDDTIDSLHGQVANLQGELDELQKLYTQLKGEFFNTEKSLDAEKSETRRLEEANSALLREKEVSRKTRMEMEISLQEKDRQLSDHQATIDALQNQVKLTEGKLDAVTNRAISHKQESVGNMETIEELRVRFSGLEEELRRAVAARDGLREELRDLQDKHEATAAHSEDLASKVGELAADVENLEREKKEALETLNRKEKALVSESAALHQARLENTRLGDEVADLQGRVTGVQGSYRRAQDSTEQLLVRSQHLESENERLQSELSSVKSELASTQHRLTSSQKETHALTDNVQQLEVDIDGLGKRKIELETQVQSRDRRLRDAEATIVELRNDLKRMEAELTEVRAAGTDSKAHTRSLTDSLEQSKSKVAVLQSDLEDSSRECNRFKDDLYSLRRQHDDASRKLHDVTEKLKMTEVERDTARASLTEAQVLCGSKDRKIGEMTEQLQLVQETSASHSRDLNGARDLISDLRAYIRLLAESTKFEKQLKRGELERADSSGYMQAPQSPDMGLRRMVEQQRGEMNQLRAKHHQSGSDAFTEVTALTDSVENLEKDRESAWRNYADIKATLRAKEGEVADADRQRMKARDEVTNLQAQLQGASQTERQLSQQITIQEKENADLREKLASFEQDKVSWSRLRVDLESSVGDEAAKVNEQMRHIAHLESQLETARAGHESAIRELKSDLASKDRQLNEGGTNLEVLSNDFQRLKKEHSHTLEENEQSVADLKRRLKDAEQDLNRRQQQTSQLQLDLTDYQHQLEVSSRKLAEAEAALDTRNSQVKKVMSELDELHADMARITRENESNLMAMQQKQREESNNALMLQEEKDRLKESLDIALVDLESSRGECKRLNGQLSEAEIVNHDQSQRLTALQDRLDGLELEKCELRTQNDALLHEQYALRANVADSELKVEEALKTYVELDTQVKTKTREINVLKAQLERANIVPEIVLADRLRAIDDEVSIRRSLASQSPRSPAAASSAVYDVESSIRDRLAELLLVKEQNAVTSRELSHLHEITRASESERQRLRVVEGELIMKEKQLLEERRAKDMLAEDIGRIYREVDTVAVSFSTPPQAQVKGILDWMDQTKRAGANSQREREDLESRLHLQKREKETLQQSLTSMQEDTSKTIRRIDDEKEQLRAEKNMLENDLATLKAQQAKESERYYALEAESKALITELQRAQNSGADTGKYVHQLNEELIAAKNERHRQAIALEELRVRESYQVKEMDSLKMKLEAALNDAGGWARQAERLESEKMSLLNQDEERKVQIASKERRVDDLQDTVQRMRQDLQRHEQLLADANSALSAAQASERSCQDVNLALKGRVSALEGEIDESKKELTASRFELERVGNRLKTLEAELGDTKGRLKKEQETMTRMRSELEPQAQLIAHQLSEEQSRCRGLQGDINLMQRALDKKDLELEERSRVISRLEKEVERGRQDMHMAQNELNNSVETFERELGHTRADVERAGAEAQERVRSLNQQIEVLNNDKAIALAEIKTLRNELDEAKDSCRRLETDLQICRGDLSSARESHSKKDMKGKEDTETIAMLRRELQKALEDVQFQREIVVERERELRTEMDLTSSLKSKISAAMSDMQVKDVDLDKRRADAERLERQVREREAEKDMLEETLRAQRDEMGRDKTALLSSSQTLEKLRDELSRLQRDNEENKAVQANVDGQVRSQTKLLEGLRQQTNDDRLEIQRLQSALDQSVHERNRVEKTAVQADAKATAVMNDRDDLAARLGVAKAEAATLEERLVKQQAVVESLEDSQRVVLREKEALVKQKAESDSILLEKEKRIQADGNTIQQLRAQILDLESQLDDASKSGEEASTLGKELTDRVSRLSIELNAAKTMSEESSKRYEHVVEELRLSRSTTEELTQELRSQAERHHQELEQSRRERSELEQSVTYAKVQAQRDEDNRESLEGRLRESRDEAARLDSLREEAVMRADNIARDLNSTRGQLKDCEDALSSMRREANDNEHRLVQMDKSAQDLKAQLDEAHDAVRREKEHSYELESSLSDQRRIALQKTEESANLKNEVSRMQILLEELRESQSLLQSERTMHLQRMDELQSSLHRVEVEFVGVRKERDTLSMANTRLSEDITRVEAELHRERAALSSTQSELQLSLSQLGDSKMALENTSRSADENQRFQATLQREVDEARRELSDLRRQLEMATHEAGRAQDEHARMVAELDSQKRICSRLQDDVKSAQLKQNEESSKRSSAEQQLRLLKDTSAQVEQNLAESKAALELAREKNSTLSAERESVQTKLLEAQSKLTSTEKAKVTLETKLSSAEEERRNLDAECAELRLRLQTREQACGHSSDALVDARREIEELRRQERDADERSRAEREAWSREKEAINEDMRRLHLDVADLRSQKKTLEGQLSDMTQQRNNLQRKENQLVDDARAAESRQQELSHRVNELASDVQNADSWRRRLHETQDELVRERRTAEQLQGELVQLRSALSSEEQRNSSLNNKYEQTRAELEAAMRKVDAGTVAQQRQDEEIRRLERRLDLEGDKNAALQANLDVTRTRVQQTKEDGLTAAAIAERHILEAELSEKSRKYRSKEAIRDALDEIRSQRMERLASSSFHAGSPSSNRS